MRLTNSEISTIFEQARSQNRAFSVGLGFTAEDIVFNVKNLLPDLPITGSQTKESFGNLVDTLTIEGHEQTFDTELVEHAFLVMAAINQCLKKLGLVFITFSPGDEDADFMLIKTAELPEYLDKGFLEV
jgi:hypothetical protein